MQDKEIVAGGVENSIDLNELFSDEQNGGAADDFDDQGGQK